MDIRGTCGVEARVRDEGREEPEGAEGECDSGGTEGGGHGAAEEEEEEGDQGGDGHEGCCDGEDHACVEYVWDVLACAVSGRWGEIPEMLMLRTVPAGTPALSRLLLLFDFTRASMLMLAATTPQMKVRVCRPQGEEEGMFAVGDGCD
jgi:hypothetical protein